jgi:hypothetical protein
MIEFTKDVQLFCEATHQEQHDLWYRYHKQMPYDSHSMGIGIQVGEILSRPVCIALSTAVIDGVRVCFYHDTSALVDHDMIREFLEKHAPASAKIDDRLNHIDATNFITGIHRTKSHLGHII